MSALDDLGVKREQQGADNHVNLFPRLNWGEPVDPDGEFVLPVGTVTLLLADVEGSTRRWEEDPSAMAVAREELRNLATEQIGRHNGVLPLDQGEGDSFVGAFAKPSEAVACAVDIQRQASLPLRIGIHVGEVHRTEEGNYVGPALNRAARLRDAGHGGQVLLSQAAAELVVEKLQGSSLGDFGNHRLRDLSRPERIFQLVHPDLRTEFPPLRTLDSYRHNLPIQPTRFIGRLRDIEAIEGLLSESSMVTLSGAGGAGKTRLALQIGANLVDDFPDGVFLCDLARVTEPEGVMAAVANAVGFGVEAAVSLVSLVSEKRLLLVLDNCEHLISSSAELCKSLLGGAPKIQILATSREPLKVEGEINYVVPSLPVPPEGRAAGIEGLAPYAASELFLDRARRAYSALTLDDDDARAVAEICRRLDGIPLAIELAAARVRVMSLREIAQGLNERFKLLTGGARTAVPRHQTLIASVDWSHDLLTELERVVLRRLSIFVGGFSLEAAKEVCSGPRGIAIGAHQVVDLLSLLVEKSLVNMNVDRGQSRYTLLETIRQYAATRLEEAGEVDEVRRSHRDHFLKSAEALSVMAEGAEGQEAFDSFVTDRENFEVAFQWSCTREDFEHAARFLSGSAELLDGIWIGEATAWVSAVIPNIEKVPEPARTDALYYSAPYLVFFGPQTHLQPLLRSCIELHRKSGDELRLGRALLAWMQVTEDKEEVKKVVAETVEVTQRSNNLHAAISAKANSAFSLGIDAEERKNRYLDDLVREINEVHAPVVRFNLGWRILQRLMLEDPHRSVALSEPLANRDFDRLSSLERHSITLHPMSLAYAGRYGEAVELAAKLIPDREDVGDMVCLSGLHFANSLSAEAEDDTGTALDHSQRSIDAFSKTGFPVQSMELFDALLRLGGGELDQPARLRDKIAEMPLMDPNTGMLWAILAASTWYLEGEIEKAEEQAHMSVAEAGAKWFVQDPSFDLLAGIAVGDESYVEATRLLAGAAARRDRIGLRWGFKAFRDLRNQTLATIKEVLAPKDFEQAWNEGSAMTIQQTVSYVQRGRGERKRPPMGWRSLTPTERQVVDFLAQGLSNKEVADKMFVSVRTITTHLTHIYSKLRVSSRTELVSLTTKRPPQL